MRRRPINPDFGRRLRLERKGAGFARHDLANVLGVAPSTISGWEKGRTEPTLGHLLSIAFHLEIPLLVLLGATSLDWPAQEGDCSPEYRERYHPNPSKWRPWYQR